MKKSFFKYKEGLLIVLLLMSFNMSGQKTTELERLRKAGQSAFIKTNHELKKNSKKLQVKEIQLIFDKLRLSAKNVERGSRKLRKTLKKASFTINEKDYEQISKRDSVHQ